MNLSMAGTVAGVDGCKAGWIAVIERPGSVLEAAVFRAFADLIDALPDDAIIAVDMPIGLPDRIEKGGRGPEALVRPLLGRRKSSVFSIPSRAAVYAADEQFTTLGRWYEAHREASVVALQTSDPPRKIAIQAFGIFSKIRELDQLLIARHDLRSRVIESHPEVAFWKLNRRHAMALPKKIRGRVNPAGMAERKELLDRHGIDRAVLDATPPRGASEDDLIDACAMLCVARRHARGETMSFPDPPFRDVHGLPIGIWV